MNEDQTQLHELLSSDDSVLDDDKALAHLAQLIDLSGDLASLTGEDEALARCDRLETRTSSNATKALLHFFRANVWGNRQRRQYYGDDVWAWEQPELQQEILQLRSAVLHPGFEQLDGVRRCQIVTNLANEFSTVGRFVEAQDYWNRALGISPTFGMALGNRGQGLMAYARAVYDPGHQGVLLQFAAEALSRGLASEAEYFSIDQDVVKQLFWSLRQQVLDVIEGVPKQEVDGFDLGSTPDEVAYRNWCLKHSLFLNPLNDLGSFSVAAQDILLLPSFSSAIDDPPSLISFFNQMKQEYASARWMLYDSQQSVEVHFSDRGVALYNTLDYPSYSLAAEKMKAAYRVSYSIFDKIAYFLNAYMSLGIKPNGVYFRTLWYQNCDAKKRMLRPEFSTSENWPLRGLYWLAKDLFDEALSDVTEPDASALHRIRNHLEHSCLKLHEMSVQAPHLWREDPLILSVERKDFDRKALRLLKLARSALIYLSLGMHQHEARKAQDKAMPLHLGLWDDHWKI